MNAHKPTAKTVRMARRPLNIGDRMKRLLLRPQGASLEELRSISGNKEQSVRSRLSKFKSKEGYDIWADPSTGNYVALRPGQAKRGDAPDGGADFVDGPSERHADPVSDEVPAPHINRVPNLATVRRLLEILAEHREVRIVGFSDRMFIIWDEDGTEMNEQIRLDLPQAIKAFDLPTQDQA